MNYIHPPARVTTNAIVCWAAKNSQPKQEVGVYSLYLHHSPRYCKYCDILISKLGPGTGKRGVLGGTQPHIDSAVFRRPRRRLQPTRVIHHADINYVPCSSKTKTLMKGLSTRGFPEISAAEPKICVNVAWKYSPQHLGRKQRHRPFAALLPCF